MALVRARPEIQVGRLDALIAIETDFLSLPHPDPADRFIAATALHLGAVLVTRDEKLHAVAGLQTLWHTRV